MRIGLFDSGIGGLTLLKELEKSLGYHHYLYMADTARFPYGNKDKDAITHYTLQGILFLIEQGADCVILACNTATTVALEPLQKVLKVPLFGIIDSAIDDALSKTKNNSIAILATKNTVRSKVYEQKIHKKHPQCTVSSIACPLLASLIEENCHSDATVRAIVQDYIQEPFLQHTPDTIILGCTHYPIIQESLTKILPQNVSIIDPSVSCAQALTLQNIPYSIDKRTIQFFVSEEKERFYEHAQRFLGLNATDKITLEHAHVGQFILS